MIPPDADRPLALPAPPSHRSARPLGGVRARRGDRARDPALDSLAERNLQERAHLAKEIDILLGSLWGRTDLRNFTTGWPSSPEPTATSPTSRSSCLRDQWRLLGSSGARRPRNRSRSSPGDGARSADVAAAARQLAPRARRRALSSRSARDRRDSREGVAVEVERLANIQAQRA